LGDDYGSVSYFDVAGDAYLSGENDIVAYVGGSGEAYLRAQESVFSDGAGVSDVDEVVDLGASGDVGAADVGAVDAGSGLDLDVVGDLDVAGLDDFVPAGSLIAGFVFASFVFGETEAVGADDDGVLQEDIVSDAAEFADYYVSVGEEVVADFYSAIDGCVRQQDGVVADLDILVDDYVRTEVRVLSYFRSGMNYCCGMDSGSVARRLIEELYGFGPRQIRVVRAQHARGDGGKLFVDYDGCRLRRFRGGCVLGIVYEGELSGDGLLDAADAGDLGVGRGIFQAGV
jgi:hypothetical protein